MKLIFNDEFDYTGAPDESKWLHETGGYWANDEIQFYTDSINNAYVKDGKLYLIAQKEIKENRNYTSARLCTYNKFSFQYGRVEVSAKLPHGKGSWPAIWMLPDSIFNKVRWPLCGEIDIMEHVGRDENMIHVSLHSEKYNHIIKTQQTHFEHLVDVTGSFHKYACEWREDYIEFFYDDRSVAKFYKNDLEDQTEKGWPFDQKFHLILNIAVGGGWGGEVDDKQLPYVMEIEYVRVYE